MKVTLMSIYWSDYSSALSCSYHMHFFYNNFKFWVKDQDYLIYQILSQKCFLFLGIPGAHNILNFYQ